MLATSLLFALSSAAASPQSDAHFNDLFDLPRYYRQLEAGAIFGVGDFNGDGRVDVLSRENFPTPFGNEWTGLTAWTLDADRQLNKSWDSGPAGLFKQVFDGEAGSVVGDFTGDGHQDFIFDRRSTSITPQGELILYAGNGDGTFKPKVELPTPSQPAGMELLDMDVGDFDGDGVNELLLSYTDFQGNDQLLWTSVSETSTNPTSATVLPFALGHLQAVDFDGDGRDEAVAVSSDNLQVAVFGYFGAAWVLLASIQVTDPAIAVPGTQIAVGDLDGDGDQDVLAWTVLGGQGLISQAFTNAGGAVLVGPVESTVAGANPVGVSQGVLSDWDNDGDAELFLDAGGAFFFIGQAEYLYENIGSGTFEYRGAVQHVGASDGDDRLLPADLDGDGFKDLVGRRSIVFGAGIADLPLEVPVISSGSPEIYQFEDFDGDGDLDARVFGDSSLGASAALLLNDASGEYPDVPLSYLGLDPDSGLEYGPILAEGDFDGDGTLEVLVQDLLPGAVEGHLVRLEKNAGGSFDEVGPGGVPGVVIERPDSLPWPVGDMDLDGFPDVIVEGGLHLNRQGLGLFQAKLAVSEIEIPLVALDWDGDGDEDVVCASSNGDLVLARNLGGLAFSAQVLRSFETAPFGRLLDRDGDGDLDLIVTAAEGRQVQIFDASPTGMLFGPALDPEPVDLQALGISREAKRTVVATDIDGNGQLDLLVGMSEFTSQSIEKELLTWLRPTSATELEVVADWMNLYEALVPADVDGDGDLDAFNEVSTTLGNVWSGAEGGGALQFGVGTPGTGGIVPILGVQGPYHTNSPLLTKRLRRGVGGGLAFYAVSTSAALLPGFPTPSSTTYIDPSQLALLAPIALSGSPGAAGEGEFDFTLQVQPFLAGLSFWEQAFVVDAGVPELIAASNALFVQLGN